MFSRAAVASFCVFAASLLFGCGGGGELDVAPVSGKVLCEGEPVTAGIITFKPIAEGENTTPGKSAAGVIQSDGTFVLTTYELNDGAIIGKHNVTYTPPTPGEGGLDEEEEGAAASTPPPKQTHACRLGGNATAEVKDEDNELTIELSPTRSAMPVQMEEG